MLSENMGLLSQTFRFYRSDHLLWYGDLRGAATLMYFAGSALPSGM